MKIRNKLIKLLLGVSILPILAMAVLLQLSMYRLSGRINHDIQEAQMDDAIEQITVHLHNYRESVVSATTSLLLAVKLQAVGVEKCLGEKTVNGAIISEDKTFGFNEDIVDLPAMQNTHHVSEPGKVDFRRQDLILVDTTQRDSIQNDLARLGSMTEVYHKLYQANLGKSLWHYTSLENGVHTVYPSGGILPEEYDPRKRTWYLAAQNSPDLWSVSMGYDAATEVLVLTISVPVFRPDSSFAGVTAIDMPMEQIFEGLLLPSALSSRVKVLLAGLGQPGEAITPELRKYMQAQSQQDHVSWQTEPQLPVLVSNDHAQYQAMMQDLLAGCNGIQTMDYLGEKSIWAYSSRIGENASLHMIIPYNSVLELAEQIQKSVLAENQNQIKVAGCILILIIVLTALIAILYARRFSYPINQLAEATEQLSQGNFEAQANITTGDELEKLAMVFNDVGPRLKEHEKVQRNLVLAGAIQKNLLPDKPPVLSNFEIAGHCLYCDETGGDYFDFIVPAGNGQTCVGIVLGDVTGHGIPAALLMASARSLIRNSSRFFGSDLIRMMQLFNDQLTEDTENDKFMTLFYGILNDRNRSMIWASGGHDPAIWYHRKTNTFEELPNTGPLMGVMKGIPFEQAGPIYLQPDDLLVIGTDGIWEAQDSHGNAYGKERLKTFIANNADTTAEELAMSIIESVKYFASPSLPEDDITLIVIKTLG